MVDTCGTPEPVGILVVDSVPKPKGDSQWCSIKNEWGPIPKHSCRLIEVGDPSISTPAFAFTQSFGPATRPP